MTGYDILHLSSTAIVCLRWLSMGFVGLLALDALYALSVWWRNRRWERTVARDAFGVLANAAPYTLEGATKTAVLFVHGFADTPETWQLVAPRVHALTNATCRVMRLPDISVPLRLQHYARLNEWLNAIRDEVARLRTCHEKVFIAGHSLGGGLALLATRENPKLADGAVVFAPLVRTPRKHEILFWLADHFCGHTRAAPNPFRGVIKTKDGRVYPYSRDNYVSFAIFRALFQMTRRLRRGAHGGRVSPPAAAHEDMRPPTLAFVSLRDRIIDIPAAMRFLEGAQIVTTSGAGHVLTLDTGWEERAEEMARFILGLRAG